MLNIKLKRLDKETFKELLPSIINLDKSFFPFPWKDSQWSKILNNDDYCLYIILLENKLIGFSLFLLSATCKLSHLLKVVIAKPNLKMGLGSKLLNFSLNDLNREGYLEHFLEVEIDNLAALHLYKVHGYNIKGTAKDFYGKGRDAFRMLTSIFP